MTVKSILQGASCKRYFTFKLQQKVLTFVPLIFWSWCICVLVFFFFFLLLSKAKYRWLIICGLEGWIFINLSNIKRSY